MKILITGAGGQLGRVLVRRLAGVHSVLAAARHDLDVCDASAVRDLVAAARPDAVVNCAAFTDVDGAEAKPVEALNANAIAVKSLAAAAAAVDALFIHFSTDFVFDGRGDRPYREDDPPNPRSTYASSKLIGEWFAQEVRRHCVLRVESLFGGALGGQRRTSVDRIADAIAAGDEVRVFTDRVVSPSYVEDVATVTEGLLLGRAPAGLYHCVNSGQGTFLDLAAEMGRLLRREPRLVPVTMESLALRAERPKYCVLSNARLAGAGFPMPSWQDALRRYLRTRDLVH